MTTAGYDAGRDAYDAVLWNEGDGTFTEGAWRAGVRAFGWHTGAAVADVNDDGLARRLRRGLHRPERDDPDLVGRLPGQSPRRPRPALPRTRADPVPRGRRAGRARAPPRRPRPRRRVPRREPRRAPRPLRRERSRPEPAVPQRGEAGRPAGPGLPLRRARSEPRRRRPERRDGRRRRRLLGRRARGPARHELARPTARRVRGLPERTVRRRAARLRAGARAGEHGLGRHVGRPRPRRRPRARAWRTGRFR